MKFLIKLFFVILIFTISCQNNNTNSFEYYYPNGKLRKKIIFKKPYNNYNIKINNFFKNGKTSEKYEFENGKLNGNYFSFFKTGQIKNIVQFKNGTINGLDRTYNDKGKLITELLWVNGTKLVWKNFAFFSGIKKWGYQVYQFNRKDVGYSVGSIVIDKKGNSIDNLSSYYKIYTIDTVKISDTCNVNIQILMNNADKTFGKVYIGNLNNEGNFQDTLIVKEISFTGSQSSFSFVPEEVGNNLILGKIFVQQDTLIQGEKYSKQANFILYHNIFVTPLPHESFRVVKCISTLK